MATVTEFKPATDGFKTLSGEILRIRLRSDTVLVQQLTRKEVTEGGLFIPETQQERPRRGRIVAVGLGRLKPDGTRVEPMYAVGETVVYGYFAGIEHPVEGYDPDEFRVMREDEILSVIAPEE